MRAARIFNLIRKPQLTARWWLACWAPLLLAGCASQPAATPAETSDTAHDDAPLRVMSLNVRLPATSDGDNYWDKRRELMATTIEHAAPDVIGSQELFKRQGDWLVQRLPQYTWFGRDRRGGHDDEHMGIFYRKAALKVVESGDFWLSDTPDQVASISWGHPLPRMVNWALFERSADGRRFYFFDTHLPYKDEDEPARLKGVQLIRKRIDALPDGVPVVITGDFNTDAGSQVHAALLAPDPGKPALIDAWESAPQRSGPAYTFHDFTGKGDKRIDWILVRGLDVQQARTIDDNTAGRYPSDHFPVDAVLGWK